MEAYIDDFGKMALALTSAQMAKDSAIGEGGIGEELATHFLGWSSEYLVLVIQMKSELAARDQETKFFSCKELCESMRKNWGVSSITMVAEGYCSFDSSATKGVELASAFANNIGSVHECLTVSHATVDDDGDVSPVSMVAAPFKVGFGKKVLWGELLVYPERADEFLRQAKYPHMLRRSLMQTPLFEINRAQILAAKDDIEMMGFLVQDMS